MLTLYTLRCGVSVMRPENVEGKVEENGDAGGMVKLREGRSVQQLPRGGWVPHPPVLGRSELP